MELDDRDPRHLGRTPGRRCYLVAAGRRQERGGLEVLEVGDERRFGLPHVERGGDGVGSNTEDGDGQVHPVGQGDHRPEPAGPRGRPPSR